MKIACLDVGGTTIKSAVVTVENTTDLKNYSLGAFSFVPTEAAKGFEKIRANIHASIASLVQKHGCERIAVSTAGTVDWDSGKVTYATDALPGFTGYDFCRDVKDTFSLPSTVINDATAAAVAEHYYGNPEGRDVVLTLGTGLGSALVKPGILDKGCVEDLHLGHIILHEDGYVCKCGKRGCAEQYVSASALKRDSGQNDITRVFTDAKFAKAKADFFDNMRRVVEVAIDKYAPDDVVIGGGVVEIKKLWWNDFVAQCGERAQKALRPAKLANKAGVLGAAYSAMCGKFENQ